MIWFQTGLFLKNEKREKTKMSEELINAIGNIKS